MGSGIPPGGMDPKEPKTLTEKKYMYPKDHSSIIYKCQDMEPTQLSINRWVNKEGTVYIQWNNTQP